MSVVNLDLIDRPVVTITLSGQTFEIRRVVMAVRRLWKSFTDDSIEAMKKVREYDERIATLREDDPSVVELAQQITADIDEFANKKIDRLLDIVALVLQKNGYEYCREWWLENGEEADYRAFILECLQKDGAKKKTAEEATAR